jgi:hypothetical protein
MFEEYGHHDYSFGKGPDCISESLPCGDENISLHQAISNGRALHAERISPVPVEKHLKKLINLCLPSSVLCLLSSVLCLLSSALWAHAADVSTNGVGGGPWSDPATWHGKKAPATDDDVVIQKNDIVIFDHADDGKPTCHRLQIDPKGGLTFKTSAGKLVLSVTEGIESYGVIRVDGTKSATDEFEIRLIGDTAEKRKIKLAKGAALLLYGRADLPGGHCNVSLVSFKDKEQKEDILGLVEAQGPAMVDWQRICVKDVKLTAKQIDNTGAKANERIKLTDNKFVGLSRLSCHTCDSIEISRNSFEFKGDKPLDEAAVAVLYSPLAEIKNNTIRGGFIMGITVNFQSDSVLIGNTIEKCTYGITGGYGIPNTMIKQTTIRGCEFGVKLEGGSGVLEEVMVEGATTAFQQQNCNLQLTQFGVKDLAKNGVAVLVETGTLSLLNCDLKPEQFKVLPQPPAAPGKPPLVPVTCLQYVIIGVKDAPPETLVEVRTSNPAPVGPADPNVRNTPAALVDGLTPLPKTLNPLIVTSWSFDLTGKLVAAPEYTVKVLGPAPKEGAPRPVLKMQQFRPKDSGFRAEPNQKIPTLEVPFK